MKKRIVSLLLALTLVLPLFSGVLPAHAEAAPAIALWINGTWCAAQNLSGSGETWVSIPIDKALLKENDTNYVRITTNVANGDTEATQAGLYFTSSTWSNTYLSEQIWVDDNWTGFTDRQANFYIAGWNGSEWQRIHDDIDTGYRTDSSHVLGKNSDGSHTNYARNIWTGANTLDKYTNYCVMVHMNLGAELTTHSDNSNLFPAENYHSCEFCEICGGCKASDCSLNHVRCNGHEAANPALRLRFNGKWYGLYLNDALDTDGQWLSVPISMDGLTAGTSYQLAASSNVVNGGNFADTSIDFYATNTTENLESFVTNDRWCDGGWNAYSDRNVNLKIEGWNGHEWLDLNAAKPAYAQDQTTVLGQFSDGTWYNPCRNIVLGDLTGIVAMRASVQVHVGKELTPMSDYKEDQFATFPEPQEVTKHEMCPQHPDSCAVEGCPYHTCGDLHHCVFCDICGKCRDTDCGCEHEKCEMDSESALRVRVNQSWYGLNISGLSGTQWVYVPVDITKLYENAENHLALSSNIDSLADNGAHSVDVFFTAAEQSDSFVTDHRWCDENWVQYADRNVNMTLEFYDGEKWVSASQEAFTQEYHTVVGRFAPEEKWYNFSRNLNLGDLTKYSAARVAVQVHVGERLNVIDDYMQEQFATFLSTALTEQTPASDVQNHVIVHRTSAKEPAAPASGSVSGRENAHLRVRLNGQWYETALEDVKTDEKGMAWVTVEVPVSQLRSSAENQVLVSSDVNPADTYSGNSVDLYATGTAGANSFANVNDYYDDWTRYETAEWNIRLEASADGEQWSSLTGSTPMYCDESYQLGRHCDGSKSHAAKNLFLGDTTGYAYARLLVQVHIGDYLGSRSEHAQSPATPATAQRSGNGGTPLLWVRVNGTWTYLDISGYKGTNGNWITCPIDLKLLRADQENYFSFTTNVVSYGDFTDSSVDFYATRVEDGFNSFLTHDPYCDNDYMQYQDRNINMVLELYDGSNWVTVPSGEQHAYDEHTVLGLHGDSDTWYNAARNLVLANLGGYTAARIRIQMHVGSSLTVQDNSYVSGGSALPVSHNTEIPAENPAVKEVKDNEELKLRVRVNGTWYETALQPYKGQKAVWVPVEIDLGILRGGEENYFQVSSTALNYGDRSANSVDVYYSNANSDLNSFLCADEYCDNGWVRYNDRNFNIRLELFNGSEWVTVAPEGESYYDGSVPVGYLGDANDWSNIARNIVLGNLDGYSAARVVVQLHVGSAIAGLDDAGLEDGAANGVDRNAVVGRPEHAAVKETQHDVEPASGGSLLWVWISLGALLALIAVCIIIVAAKRRNRSKTH